MRTNKPAFLRHLPIILLILVNTAIGLAFVRDYGESWDEASVHRLAGQSLQAYPNLILRGKLPDFDGSNVLSYYGPAFAMAGALLSKLFRLILPAWSPIDGWHFTYFLAFQAGILSLYLLARKWMSAWAAFGSALLFSTQPLLWGHAFMNPRDIPFMAFFLASVASGIGMVDSVSLPSGEAPGHAARIFSLSTLKQTLRMFLKPPVLAAGCLLGFTTSIRVLGPFAGGIVALYAVYKSRRQAFAALVPYFLVAGLTSYLTWPFLWGHAIVRFFESLVLMSRFPYVTRVLFHGDLVSGDALPKTYLPVLFSVQLTEVLLPLFAAGFGLSAWALWKRKKVEPFVLTLVWFLLPVTALILGRSVLYDNFRQLLFLLPPVFITAGFALEALFEKVRQGILRAAILGLLVLPGLVACVSLHPYQYIYYNSFVGGVRGAFRSYELDYWGTSYREAALYLNQAAPKGAMVAVSGPIHLLRDYARPDMVLSSLTDILPGSHFDFVVLNSRRNEDQTVCRTASTAKTIERDGAGLTAIKIPPASGLGECP